MPDKPDPAADAAASAPDPAQPAPDLLEATVKRGKPLCPVCSGDLDVYDGSNPLKVGTGFCQKCGARRALKG